MDKDYSFIKTSYTLGDEFILLLLLFTAIGLSPGGSSPTLVQIK
jgi:hypothetical protein